MDRETLLSLLPAYALGALDQDEHAAVDDWITSDPEAQALLADYQAVADHLSLAVPLRQAPTHLEADLRQRLAGTSPAGVMSLPDQRMTARRRDLRWQRLALPLVAVFVLVVIGAIYIWSRETDTPTTNKELYAQIIAQNDAQRLQLTPADYQVNLSGELAVSSNGTEAVICFWALPELTPDQTFQLWLLDDQGALHSGGLFQSSEPDDTYIRLPLDASISSYQAVGVSIEPAGGSPFKDKPSGPRVFRVEF
jgi:anti-sigma-K factor RskA